MKAPVAIFQAFFLSFLLLGGLTLTGCGSSGDDSKSAEPDFTFISGADHNFLDPQKMTWDHDIRIAGCLYERLVRYKLPELTIVPGVAAAWEISPDKLTYTFHLRPEARWSNGVPVTANDFIFAWRRALLPDFAFDYTQLFYRIAGGKEFFDWREEAAGRSGKGELGVAANRGEIQGIRRSLRAR